MNFQLIELLFYYNHWKLQQTRHYSRHTKIFTNSNTAPLLSDILFPVVLYEIMKISKRNSYDDNGNRTKWLWRVIAIVKQRKKIQWITRFLGDITEKNYKTYILCTICKWNCNGIRDVLFYYTFIILILKIVWHKTYIFKTRIKNFPSRGKFRRIYM